MIQARRCWRLIMLVGIIALGLAEPGCNSQQTAEKPTAFNESTSSTPAPQQVKVANEESQTAKPEKPADRAAKTKLKIATTGVTSPWLPLFVALERGFFESEGLAAENIVAKSDVLVSGLVSGDLDYSLGIGAGIRSAAKGLPVKVFASFVNGGHHALLAKPEIKTAQDLKGKTIAVSTFGATAHVNTVIMVTRGMGLKEDDVQWLAIGQEEARVAALQSLKVDAVGVTFPGVSILQQDGFNTLAKVWEIEKRPFTGLVANQSKRDTAPEEIKAVLRAILKAIKYLKDNPEDAAQIFAKLNNLPLNLAEGTVKVTLDTYNETGAIPPEIIEAELHDTQIILELDRPIDPQTVFDFSYLEAVRKELNL